MNRSERITRACDITDKRSMRLATIEAVAHQLTHKYGGCGPDCKDESQAALWYWIAQETRAAIEALDELSDLVREVEA